MAKVSINNCVLSGNIGKDPVVTEMENGKVARFPLGIATWKEDETTWANLVAFGKLAEVIEKHCTKGTGITVVARYQSRKYTKDGESRYSHEFIVDQMKFDGGKSVGGYEEEAASSPAPAKRTAAPASKKAATTLTEELEEDDAF